MDNVSFDDLEPDSEFIPLMTSEDEEALEKEKLPEVLPILPLINTVLFPGVVIPINAGRDKSIKLIQDANKSNKLIGVVTQKNKSTENPGIDDIYHLGTVAKITIRRGIIMMISLKFKSSIFFSFSFLIMPKITLLYNHNI